MKTQKKKITILVLAVLAGGAACAWGEVAATVDESGVAVAQAFAGHNGGWRFTVNQEITITHLGVLDSDGVGLQPGTKVGLWKNPRAGGFVFICSVEIGGTVGELDGHHRYVAITPVTLTPDTAPPSEIGQYRYIDRYVLGVWSPVGAPDRIKIPSRTGVTHSSAINLGESWPQGFPPEFTAEIYRTLASSDLLPPWGATSGDHFGVNFKYTVNHPPVAGGDTAVTQINTPVAVDVLANDSDPDGDSLTVTDFTAGAHGTVMAVEGKLVYTPDLNFVGSDSFTYTISDGNGGTATATVSVTVNPGTIAIDIKPGSYPNSINLGANGVIPVAILSSETFDATALDPETISLEGLDVAVRGRGNRYLSHSEDVNGDGRADLLVQFDTENFVPGEFQDGTATLTVATLEYVLYLGEDEITIVPPLP